MEFLAHPFTLFLSSQYFLLFYWRFTSTYLGINANAAAGVAPPTPSSVCTIFFCPSNSMVASVRDLYNIVHISCSDLPLPKAPVDYLFKCLVNYG